MPSAIAKINQRASRSRSSTRRPHRPKMPRLHGSCAAQHRLPYLNPWSGADRGMDGAAMFGQAAVRNHELLQWGLDVVKVDIGDKTIDRRIDPRRLFAMHIAMWWD